MHVSKLVQDTPRLQASQLISFCLAFRIRACNVFRGLRISSASRFGRVMLIMRHRVAILQLQLQHAQIHIEVLSCPRANQRQRYQFSGLNPCLEIFNRSSYLSDAGKTLVVL
ncbi:hypothetical protein M3J09_002458 [Ascochyta lentis]